MQKFKMEGPTGNLLYPVLGIMLNLLSKNLKSIATLAAAFLLCSCQSIKPKSSAVISPKPVSMELEAIVNSYQDLDTGILFPTNLGNYQLVSIQNYDRRTPGLGNGISYRSPESKLEFFIYDWENPIVPDGIDSPTIKQAHDKAVIDVQRTAATGFYTNFQTQKTDQVEIAEHPFFHTRFSYREDGALKESHLFVSGFNTQIFKIRLTLNRRSIDIFNTNGKAIYQHVEALTRGARNEGYTGISFDEIKVLKSRLEDVTLADGLDQEEALTVAQVELINRGFAQAWNLLNPIDIAVNSSSDYRANFPNRANSQRDKTLAVLIDSKGNVAIEETL